MAKMSLLSLLLTVVAVTTSHAQNLWHEGGQDRSISPVIVQNKFLSKPVGGQDRSIYNATTMYTEPDRTIGGQDRSIRPFTWFVKKLKGSTGTPVKQNGILDCDKVDMQSAKTNC